MSEIDIRVITVEDDPTLLQDAVSKIAEEDGLIINLVWQPARTVTVGGTVKSVESGYVIVADFEADHRAIQ